MSQARFDKAFARFLGREERVTPKTFFEVIAEIERESMVKTIELHAKVVGGQLRFDPSPELTVYDNEIVVGDQRIVVNVEK